MKNVDEYYQAFKVQSGEAFYFARSGDENVAKSLNVQGECYEQCVYR
jgi:hypothetical protein